MVLGIRCAVSMVTTNAAVDVEYPWKHPMQSTKTSTADSVLDEIRSTIASFESLRSAGFPRKENAEPAAAALTLRSTRCWKQLAVYQPDRCTNWIAISRFAANSRCNSRPEAEGTCTGIEVDRVILRR